ncbi:MAG: hypothetical protein JNK82_35810 [Myxococcaceae bacterium]|nr:hypothetical protein [Myxococcaceae bacterium]
MLALGIALLASAATPEQQERDERGACIMILITDTNPARAEWTWWLGAGGGLRDFRTAASRAVFAARLGAGVSFGLATLPDPGYGGPYELRWGPWLGAETQLDGALGEGGLEVSFGQEHHARWGTYSVRLGGGYGFDAGGPSPHLSITATGGVRSVPARYTERGACDPPAMPLTHAFASGVRIFATLRVPFAGARGIAFVAGLEFEPSFFLPPYSLSRWLGSAP